MKGFRAKRLPGLAVGEMDDRFLAHELLRLVAQHARESIVHPQVAPVDGEADPDQGALQDDVALGERAVQVVLQLACRGDVGEEVEGGGPPLPVEHHGVDVDPA
jgi:hypothetical protein